MGRELRTALARERTLEDTCLELRSHRNHPHFLQHVVPVESRQAGGELFDRGTYLLVYTASGIAGSLVSLWWHPQGIGAGASGAIFGLAGGLIAVLYLGKLPIAKVALK